MWKKVEKWVFQKVAKHLVEETDLVKELQASIDDMLPSIDEFAGRLDMRALAQALSYEMDYSRFEINYEDLGEHVDMRELESQVSDGIDWDNVVDIDAQEMAEYWRCDYAKLANAYMEEYPEEREKIQIAMARALMGGLQKFLAEAWDQQEKVA